jgi:phage shock protein PspC (stress-responsive transcriptional regulator)
MEKIISINFHGRVIPIEEGAYNELKKYIDSLRGHFANEESSEEIIHDIEYRIAELFAEKLKSGISCIGKNELNAVIDSIGRLEDIEAAEQEETQSTGSTMPPPAYQPQKGRFFRNADDKMIAGVCSGIAIRSGIDPVIVRLLFVLLIGVISWIYILLWIIVPSKSFESNITRRLYRNPDNKMIAGVCSGLAVYFRVDKWIPRLIFALPLIVSIFSGSMHAMWWPWGFGSSVFAGSFGSGMFIIYVVLWIALPYATTATDKLEMRGEKIDINSIKAATIANATAPVSRVHTAGSGLGRAIGLLFKAFFLFIAGIMALSLFGVLIGLLFAGMVAFPFTDFVLNSTGQYATAWTSLALFLGIPLLALITWLVRRMIGVRSHRHYLGYIFAGLWVIGLLGLITSVGIFADNFRYKSVVEEAYQIQQPSGNSLLINTELNSELETENGHNYWCADWEDDEDMPFRLVDKDQLWLRTVKINVAKSPDSFYHIYEHRISRGNTTNEARKRAQQISFGIQQLDSVITLPDGFAITTKDKFRNQQVILIVEVPLGKSVSFNENVNKYVWFNVNVDGRSNFNVEQNDYYNSYRNNSTYVMTSTGLINSADSSDKRDLEEDE